MNNIQSGHTATLLNNGKVLVIGGDNFSTGGTDIYDNLLYNPDTETFTNSIYTNYNVLSLLDNGKILSFGDEISDSCYELLSYDTSTESFSNTGQCSKALTKNTKINNGKILFSGGYNSGNIQKRLELYDPDEVKNTYIGNMKSSRYTHTATVLQDGRVLITGGVDSSGNSLSTAEIYSP